MNRSLGHLFLSGGAAIAFSFASSSAFAQAKVFEISSTTFKDGGMLPVKAAFRRRLPGIFQSCRYSTLRLISSAPQLTTRLISSSQQNFTLKRVNISTSTGCARRERKFPLMITGARNHAMA